MVRRAFRNGTAAKVRLVGLKTEEATPEEGEAECNAAIAALSRPFDVVLLGMGTDGHTASLFSQTSGFQKAIDVYLRNWCSAIRSPALTHPRLTLTVPALLDACEIILLITGEEKLRVYESARQLGPIEMLPVRAILNQDHVPVRVFWAP